MDVVVPLPPGEVLPCPFSSGVRGSEEFTDRAAVNANSLAVGITFADMKRLFDGDDYVVTSLLVSVHGLTPAAALRLPTHACRLVAVPLLLLLLLLPLLPPLLLLFQPWLLMRLGVLFLSLMLLPLLPLLLLPLLLPRRPSLPFLLLLTLVLFSSAGPDYTDRGQRRRSSPSVLREAPALRSRPSRTRRASR